MAKLATPENDALPTLKKGAKGFVVARLQNVLTNGAPGRWEVTPGAVDEKFGSSTKASVKALQEWAGIPVTGVVDELTWGASLDTLGATLSATVGLDQVRAVSGD